MDSSKVKIYKQVGASPNPATDTLLTTDTTIIDGVWSVTANLSVGRHIIYSVALDLAGNISQVSDAFDVARLPVPMYVSEPAEWQIGELHNTYLGEIDVSV